MYFPMDILRLPNACYEGVNVEVMRTRNGEIMAETDIKNGKLPDVDYVCEYLIRVFLQQSDMQIKAVSHLQDLLLNILLHGRGALCRQVSQ